MSFKRLTSLELKGLAFDLHWYISEHLHTLLNKSESDDMVKYLEEANARWEVDIFDDQALSTLAFMYTVRDGYVLDKIRQYCASADKKKVPESGSESDSEDDDGEDDDDEDNCDRLQAIVNEAELFYRAHLMKRCRDDVSRRLSSDNLATWKSLAARLLRYSLEVLDELDFGKKESIWLLFHYFDE